MGHVRTLWYFTIDPYLFTNFSTTGVLIFSSFTQILIKIRIKEQLLLHYGIFKTIIKNYLNWHLIYRAKSDKQCKKPIEAAVKKIQQLFFVW